MIATLTVAELREMAQKSFDQAKETADRRNIPVRNVRKAFSDREMMSYSATKESYSIGDDPDFCDIDHFDGMRAWGSFLSFDLRNSTRRAMEVGPRDTFITMHTYLPTLLQVIKEGQGTVVGLRGDGALAMFGVVRYDDDEITKVKPEQAETAARLACDCGHGLIECIQKAINPVLEHGGVKAGLQVGVGIDVGEFVATKIGIERAYDLTAYGDCVNKACHRADHGRDRVVVTNEVRRMFPKSKGGRTGFSDVPNQPDAYYLNYPVDYRTIK